MKREAYIIIKDDLVGCYIPGKYPITSSTKRENFNDFIMSIKDMFPTMRIKYVRNQGIEEKILKNAEMLKQIQRNNQNN